MVGLLNGMNLSGQKGPSMWVLASKLSGKFVLLFYQVFCQDKLFSNDYEPFSSDFPFYCCLVFVSLPGCHELYVMCAVISVVLCCHSLLPLLNTKCEHSQVCARHKWQWCWCCKALCSSGTIQKVVVVCCIIFWTWFVHLWHYAGTLIDVQDIHYLQKNGSCKASVQFQGWPWTAEHHSSRSTSCTRN